MLTKVTSGATPVYLLTAIALVGWIVLVALNKSIPVSLETIFVGLAGGSLGVASPVQNAPVSTAASTTVVPPGN